MLNFPSLRLLMLNVRLFVRVGSGGEGASEAQMCSPIAAIAISVPQPEQVMDGKMLTGRSPLARDPTARDMVAMFAKLNVLMSLCCGFLSHCPQCG
jgi:hypothetical protein